MAHFVEPLLVPSEYELSIMSPDFVISADGDEATVTTLDFEQTGNVVSLRWSVPKNAVSVRWLHHGVEVFTASRLLVSRVVIEEDLQGVHIRIENRLNVGPVTGELRLDIGATVSIKDSVLLNEPESHAELVGLDPASLQLMQLGWSEWVIPDDPQERGISVTLGQNDTATGSVTLTWNPIWNVVDIRWANKRADTIEIYRDYPSKITLEKAASGVHLRIFTRDRESQLRGLLRVDVGATFEINDAMLLGSLK